MENLLKDILLEHVKSPKNRGLLEKSTHKGNSNNPVCGDVVKIELLIDENVLVDVGTDGNGCAISQASMSILSQEIKGENKEKVKNIINSFKNLLGIEGNDSNDILSEEAKILKFLKSNPSKVRCALLSWEALEEALS